MISGPDNFSEIGGAFAQALFNGLWVGIAVAAVVSLFVRFHHGLNAASRHAAWYAALLIIAAMPVVSIAVSLARVQVSTVPPAAPLTTSADVATAFDAGPPAAAPATAPSASIPFALPAASPQVLERITIGVAALLGAIALARIALLIGGLFGLARVKRASRIVDPSLAPTLARTIERDLGARAVHVRVSDSLDAPAAAGFRRPAILLPRELVETLDASALDQIAMHEYAHLRRYDDWTNLIQRFVERLYWFNPAVWFIAGQIDLEREIACDDWAVDGADGVSGYANCLWHLARDGRLPSFAVTAPGAFLSRSQIAARIEHLLERHRDGAPTLRVGKLLAMVPVLAAALALVIGRAPAIALHEDASATVHPSVEVRIVAALAGAPATALSALPGTSAAAGNPKCPNIRARSANVHTLAVRRAQAVARRAEQVATARSSTARASARVAIATVDNAAAATAVNRSAATAVNASAVAAVKAAMAAQHIAIQEVVHQAMQARQHAIIKAVHVRVPAIVAAAIETDNLSYGPEDRNLLAHCTGCDLSNKNLRNADLHSLTLTGDDLSGADLRGANLRNTVLTGVDLSNAKLDGADLRGAVFTGSDIDGASFSGAKMDGARFVGMQLTASILAGSSARSIIGGCAGCDLSGLDLRGRDLHGITLDGADLHGTDLRGANLQGARFNGVDLAGARFDGADLRNAWFNGCDLTNVDLNHAKTDGIQLQGSTLGSDGNGSP